MFKTTQIRKKQQTSKRIIAFALLACFVVASLLSVLLITANAGHSHHLNETVDYCRLCIDIARAVKLLSNIAVAGSGVLFTSLFLLITATDLYAALSPAWVCSPVRLKIRMNN